MRLAVWAIMMTYAIHESQRMLYGRGEGVPKNPDRARQLLQQACGGGEAYACAMLKR